MKNTRVARNTAKLSVYGTVRDLTEREQRRKQSAKERERPDTDTGEFFVLRVSKVFSAAHRNFSPRRIRSRLLKAAKGAIIFHFRYRASYRSLSRPALAESENRRGRVVSAVKNHWR